MTDYPNILLVSGSGRKSGKTSFLCRLLNQYSFKYKITSIKISPHIHNDQSENPLIFKSTDYIIEKEINPERAKDSSRMLKSGANEVFYIQTKDESLKDACEIIMKRIPLSTPVVCESGGAAKYIKPGFRVFMKKDNPEKEREDNVDLTLSLSDLLDFDMSHIQFKDNKWQMI